MAHLTVTLTLLFLACVCAAPVPEQDKPKFSLLKSSSFGLGAAHGNSKAHGIVEGNSSIGEPVSEKTGDNESDIALVEDVNLTAAFANQGSIASGIVRNTQFANPANFFGFS